MPDWTAIKAAYVAGRQPRELAAEFKVKIHSIYKQIARQNWTELRREAAKNVLIMSQNSIAARVARWTDATLDRAEKFRSVIGSALSGSENLGADKLPLALDQLTKAEVRMDDIGRRALGLVDPKAVDITSGGMPLGTFQGALEQVRELVSKGEAVTVDVEAIAGGELEDS